MIELVSRDRCISCNICVKVCPTFVFDTGDDGIPVIARQEDCQTCFMCEAYCPADALFVAHHADEKVSVDEAKLIENGLLGSWRSAIGWGRNGGDSMASYDTTPVLRRIRPGRA
ncbi:Choline trimethylamine-lyase activating enzyme [Paenibacillus plantiphilus]|uniref:Choline trimethylamine-lyase activating enzyme n=1 Tax=Paenibacillus plantiphilus TaxID=2905650 RepID=A0ABM9CAY6_9BACL|nr:ferredoxin family protein [Paenibacillus plantiphilus]CAH1209399.1 Choline trimethylamine-lyase activating enzyme [Paenibacillus plantiphilus]